MICVSIAESTSEACLRALAGLDFAEVRIDALQAPSRADIRRIFSRRLRLIATCRPGKIADRERLALLGEAVLAGAAFVDVEHDAARALKAALMKTARAADGKVLISYHDFEKTPARPVLERIIGKSFREGADAVKIACRVLSAADNARLLGLLDSLRPLAVVGMGPLGKITRIVAPLVGGLFTYASLRPGKEVAEGQIDAAALRKIWERLNHV
jgi:3-dehydroquinate dehydratase I